MPAKLRVSKSNLEETLASQIEWAGLPTPQRQYRFEPTRRWLLDFAWPKETLLTTEEGTDNNYLHIPVALEVQGGLFARGGGQAGRHVRGKGAMNDWRKWTEASLQGWKVVLVSPQDVRDGTALRLIERALGVQSKAWVEQ